MTLNVAYSFYMSKTHVEFTIKKKNDIFTMKNNNNANFQGKEYSHKHSKDHADTLQAGLKTEQWEHSDSGQ